ncbi:hypothetical protein J7394_21925 [Ruegeria sp. R13_0]|uniref:glycosyltransferase family 2 protein n=1 Tax=Ruegeria sp. R13_0 TaxID=2821099 RepID=UPI001ADC423F|nr:hypothetical protein [Ruegeria sp. R13_0]MBO9436874.1 hypothetical protein [Ruegeria sp. R13_0]
MNRQKDRFEPPQKVWDRTHAHRNEQKDPSMPPILFLIFNRPDKTRAVFETIRQARPARLYIAADGPRSDSEAAICDETRSILNEVDWPCEVQTLFREQNLGCGRAVSGAITWFFEHEPEGIILEDDILVDPDFFEFAAEMLERYRDDPRVTSISAFNRLNDDLPSADSYFFSAFWGAWGWATWRRAWAHYDFDLSDLGTPASIEAISNMCPTPGGLQHWMAVYSNVKDGKIDTWDYQWQFAQWMNSGLTVIPGKNMVQNIGFDGSATHTTNPDAKEASLRAQPLPRPLAHPDDVIRSAEMDDYAARNILKIKPIRFTKRFKKWLRGDVLAWK